MAFLSESREGKKQTFLLGVAVLLFVGSAAGWVILRVIGMLHPPDFEHAPNQALHFLGLCFGIAGLTTAFVQVVRVLIPIRGEFHRQQLLERWNRTMRQWLEEVQNEDHVSKYEALDLLMAKARAPLKRDAVAALEEFESRGGKGRIESSLPVWLYDLAIEQLTGQIALTLDAALDDYERYPFLILCAFGPSASAELIQALRPYVPPAKVTQDAVPASASTPSSDRALDGAPASYRQDPQLLAKAEARSTLMRMAQFEVDSIQIAVGSLWRRRLRGWVVGISTLMSMAFVGSALWQKPSDYKLLPSIALYSVIGGLVAGYLAMILRDIFAMIEGRRRGA